MVQNIMEMHTVQKSSSKQTIQQASNHTHTRKQRNTSTHDNTSATTNTHNRHQNNLPTLRILLKVSGGCAKCGSFFSNRFVFLMQCFIHSLRMRPNIPHPCLQWLRAHVFRRWLCMHELQCKLCLVVLVFFTVLSLAAC